MSLFTRIVVWTCAAAFSALSAVEGLSRYATFHNRTFDLALYTRQAWGLAHGEWWDPISGTHFFGSHVAVVLWPLGLIGRWLGTVHVLIFAQALAFGLATLPLAQIGARRFGNAGALAATCAWLLYPNIGHVASYEFHPGSLAVLPLSLAIDAIDRRSSRALIAYAFSILLCRADFSLVVLALGACAYLPPAAMKRTGIAVACLGLAYLALQFTVLSAYWPKEGSLAAHFGAWGGSPLGIVPALFENPPSVIDHFAAPQRLGYLPTLLLPLFFLPLFAPRFVLLALPTLALNLISTFPTSIELYSHYLTIALPSLVAAALEGAVAAARWLSRVMPAARAQALLLVALAACSAAASRHVGGLPWSRDYDRADFVRDVRGNEAARTLANIPPDVSVQAPDGLLAHMAERKYVYRGPPPHHGAQYVVLDVSHRLRYAHEETLLRTTEEPRTRTFLARRDYGVVYAEPSLLTLRKGHDPRAGLARRYFPREPGGRYGVILTDCLVSTSAWLAPDGLELEFYAQPPCPNDLALRLGPDEKSTRVDLLFDGLLSPVHLRDEYVLSFHPLDEAERQALRENGLFLGVLRSSGAPPNKEDIRSIQVPLLQ